MKSRDFKTKAYKTKSANCIHFDFGDMEKCCSKRNGESCTLLTKGVCKYA